MRVILAASLVALASVVPAAATDVLFSGTVVSVCALAAVPGTLGIDANGALSSVAGTSGSLTVTSSGTHTLTIAPPVWVSTASGYTAGTEGFQVGYSALSASVAAQAMTSQSTTRNIGTIAPSSMGVDALATNTNGFAPGAYSMKVVATCS